MIFVVARIGDPDTPDTIVIPAVSHQSAWYLGGPQAVRKRSGPSRYHRDSLHVPPECLVSGCSECGPEVAGASRYHRDSCHVPSECGGPGVVRLRRGSSRYHRDSCRVPPECVSGREAVGPGFSFGCPRGLGTGLARRRGSATLRQMISSRISFRRGPHRVPQSDSVVARNFSKLAGPFRYHRDSRLVPPECLISRRSYGGKGEDRTLQIPSRFPPCPTRVPSI